MSPTTMRNDDLYRRQQPPASPRGALRRWLDAEARGEDAAAERALAEAMAALPRPLLSAGFAERVLRQVALAPALPAPWRLERAALGLLVACAAALSALPLWLPRAWAWLSPERWIESVTTLLVGGARLLAHLAPLWEALVHIGAWTALALSAPPALLALALCGLLAAMAGRLLVSLLDERSSGHAQVG